MRTLTSLELIIFKNDPINVIIIYN